MQLIFDYFSIARKMDSDLGYRAIGCDSCSEICRLLIKKLNRMVIPKCLLRNFATSPMPENNIVSEDLELVSEEIVGLNLVNI